MGYRIGVDIGGSFTDFAILDESSREIKTLKVLSRPDKPGQEVITGIETLQTRYGIAPANVSYFTHGTTVGVNAVIQRTGLRLALFTTENFSDVLELGRLKLPSMYDLLSRRPAPLISRDMVFGVKERMTAEGTVETPLNRTSVEAALRAALDAGAEGVIISFLHSYRNPVHEREAKALIEQLAPKLPVFASAEVWPIIREYERAITAIIGGYVQPRVAHYLTELQAALKSVGVGTEARLTKSNGGVMSAEQGKRDCVQMILSGTAAGVIGASFLCQQIGLAECMSLDIGGTSADVALINGGEPQYGVGEYVGEHQIFIPSVSVTSIGEGGGSIGWIDAHGVLKVGPDSAGSTPGPACYGRGGMLPTITDAFAVCGIIGQSDLGYSAIHIDVERGRAAIAPLAEQLRKTPEEVAEAIIRIAVSGMHAQISSLVTRFGMDPRTMALVAFGGAGPMMGGLLARELNMSEVLVPLVPGVLSALGGLIADVKNDFVQTIFLDLDVLTLDTLNIAAEDLRARALRWLRDEQGYQGPYSFMLSADMRYRGQSFEIETRLDPDTVSSRDVKAVAAAFHHAHQRMYGHSDDHAAIQIINLRLVIAGETPKPELPRLSVGEGIAVPERSFDVWMDGGWREACLYRRGALLAGTTLQGPAIVTQDDTTTFIPDCYHAVVDEMGNLRIRRSPERPAV